MWLVFVVVLCGIFACTPTDTPDAEPTEVLVPPTITSTSAPLLPTATVSALPRAGDIGSPTPAETASTPESTTTGVSLELDEVAAELVALAQRRVAQDLNIPVRRVELVEVEAYVWPDTSLGCPLPDQSYTQVNADGYRIVLAVGDTQYLFHTDFDRVIPCDADNERLPEDQ